MTSNYGQDGARRFDDREVLRRDPSDPSPSSSGIGCKLIVGCFGIMFLFFLCFGVFGAFIYGVYEKIDSRCQEYLTLADQQKHREQYDMLHPKWKNQTPYEIFEAIEEARRLKLGAFIRKTVENFDSSEVNGVQTATFIYEVEYDKGTARITFTLEELNDVWMITDAQIESDALRSDAYCPGCNAPLVPNAKFCSSCGREITPFDWDVEPDEVDADAIENNAIDSGAPMQ